MATKDASGIRPARKEYHIIDESSEGFELQQQLQLEILIEATITHSTDIGDPDPFCVVKEVRKDMLGASVVGKTETINSTKNAVFRVPIFVPYLFEEEQILQFSVYDYDFVGGNDLIGEIAIEVNKLVKERENGIELKLQKKQKCTGVLRLHVDMIPPIPPQTISLKFSASLPKKFFNPNSYLVLEKIRSDRKVLQVYTSEKRKHTSNPVWNNNVKRELIHTNDDSELRFSLYTASTFSKYKLFGKVEMSYDELSKDSGEENKGFISKLKNNVLVKSPSVAKNSFDDNRMEMGTHYKIEEKGHVTIKMSEQKNMEDYFPFLDENDITLRIHVAIDFTASNGQHNDIESLHTVTGSGNKYVEVLKSSLPGLLSYADTPIAVYGFGAKLRGATETSHCFQIYENEQNKEINGIDDLLAAYKSTLEKVTLSGPTVFSKVIKTVAHNVFNQGKERNVYNILLIITDGVICDRETTVDSIVYASYLPMSIVIVGVGDADFTDMRRLDGDLRPLKNGRNQRMIRDIVQFVSLKSIERNREAAKQHEKEDNFMTKAINREIPEQILEYYNKYEKQIQENMKKPYKSIKWWVL